MKATLEIDDEMMERLREEARRRKTTVAALVKAGLRHILDECGKPQAQNKDPLPHLPKWRSGLLVDISNRDELFRIFDQDDPLFNQDANTRQ